MFVVHSDNYVKLYVAQNKEKMPFAHLGNEDRGINLCLPADHLVGSGTTWYKDNGGRRVWACHNPLPYIKTERENVPVCSVKAVKHQKREWGICKFDDLHSMEQVHVS